MSVLVIETLIQVFEPSIIPDLSHIVQKCSVFHDIAIMMYRHMQYSSSESFGTQIVFWEHAHDGMYGIPRSVALDNALKHPSQGVWTGDNYHYQDDEALQLQIDVWVRLLSFISLHALSISHCPLPDSESFSYLLQGWMHLPGGAMDFSGSYGLFPWLPLEELSLLGENTVYDPLWQDDTSAVDREAGSFLRLHTVRSIRKLTIDLNTRNCACLANRTPYSDDISFDKLSALHLRLTNDTEVDLRMSRDIAAFLNVQCASVKTLELLGFAELTSDDFRLRPGALRHLMHYKGPAAIAPGVAATGCPLTRLETNDLTMSVLQASSILGKVGSQRKQLEFLDITIQEWDTEILYAIAHLFRDIREAVIVSMPSVFFDKMTKMTMLHIYNPQSVLPRMSHRGYSGVGADMYYMSWEDDLGPSASDMVLELMVGWSKRYPKLMEVKWEKERLLSRQAGR
ncbi:hypothetical protein F5146DRAFT_1002276 [Armillaria mellea]|nr:hypothetical protein F5146DRAFT_1002276 [Armillaria mellea]